MVDQDVAREMVAAFSAADFPRMRSVLADDLKAYITNREGGVDAITGADAYLARVEAMDLPSARFRIELAQLVTVRPGWVMIMVEVHAARSGTSLHNHAAHLLQIQDGVIRGWWMVEALPAESDEFWSSTA